MKKIILFLVVFFALALGYSHAGSIKAATDPWPSFCDPSDPEEGLAVQILRAAYAAENKTVDIEYLPWARAKRGVLDADYDILFTLWYNDDRATRFYYSQPYAFNTVKFIKRKGDDFEYTGMDSLTGKNIGTIRDYAYSDEFAAATHFKQEEVATFILNIRKLVGGRIDLTLEDEIVARGIIEKEAPELLDKIEFVDNPFARNGIHVASSLAHPRHKELVGAFNRGLEKIKEGGQYDAILQKYGLK
ncbi:amino acid ABC transporter substrate-binding protein (PAAT family) [Desulfobotulus alkaliphilus]|uniref:Amino acid ABC transporter substrate-binding protein (PAAT family) n=1 Tax=Desulfobotulus alkaliphilus TaxID=622671 RepID=A0A562R537_9BACT|nr:transporter substrate-binding domain-containing protein [Desulfobotulus alkaliphilus]TWI64167.1 amino acid ABC transporter substrate-binding protein (PAAT family) [Desulfobotulus alkaliphilus]